jgi:hypothetical protein
MLKYQKKRLIGRFGKCERAGRLVMGWWKWGRKRLIEEPV